VEHWVELGRALQVGLFSALTLVAVRLWRRRGGAAAARLAVSFAVLAAVVLLFWILPDTGWQWARKCGVAALLLYPLLLFSFAVTFRPPSRWRTALAVGSTVVVMAWTFALPHIPHPGAPRPAGCDVFVVGAFVQWTVLSLAVAIRLWLAGRGLATVARRRMRMLSVGAAVMAAVVLVDGLARATQHSALDVSLQIVSLGAALFVLLGFAPPAILRMAWRRREEGDLRKAELELMKASTPGEVAAPLLAPIARMLGGEGLLLADSDGGVLAVHDLDDADAAQVASRVAAGALREPSFHDGVLALPLRRGWLVVHASPYAPFFGDDEIALVRRLGLVIDMALERVESLRNDRMARDEVEQARAEMESLLYTVSHDLKSPLLTVLGYIDLLRNEGSVPEGQATQFIERMEGSALYMQHLISDLLELSRIGRREATAENVDLAAVVAEVGDEMRARHPTAYIGIGLLPVVMMSPVRARQLITNLLDNAVVHSGRSDVTIEVGAQRRPDGAARVWVVDDGQGVAPEHHERVFGVFERLDARAPGDMGTGIGLAACRKIVEHVGGSIQLAEVQRGTRVEFLLPAEVVRWQPSPVAVGR
jgi:signal transduction histidine kinase